MQKLKYAYVVPYLLVLLAVFVALNPLWLRAFPRLELYQGRLAFSVERAFADLETLASQYPNRSAGSPASLASAQWMSDQFRIMGLDTRLEPFETFAPDSLLKLDFLFRPIASTHRQITGTNVVAFSRGKSASVVLLMAHRDEHLDLQSGHENNASGSAMLLEMARALASGEHYYSYLFVSTDAAESRQQGAHFLEQFHSDLSLRLAISIDDVASAGTYTLGLFNTGNARQTTPLWTVALAQQVMAEQGLPIAYLNAYPHWSDSQFPNHPFLLLLSLLNQHGLGLNTTTDSEVFLERGNAVLGIEAVNTRNDHNWAAQSQRDTLLMAGQFVETYVRSLELNQFDDALLSRLYIIWQGQYLPALSVQIFAGLLLTAYALLVVLPFVNPAVSWDLFANYLRRDLGWLFEIGLLAALASSVWLLPLLTLFRGFSPASLLVIMLAILVVGGIRLVRKRQYALRLWHFEPTMDNQRRLLAGLLLVFYLLYNLLFSSFVAATLLFIPFVLWSAAQFRSLRARKIWMWAFIGWSLLHALLSTFTLHAALSRIPPWSMAGLFTFALNASLWLVILVYVFSTPPLGVIERR